MATLEGYRTCGKLEDVAAYALELGRASSRWVANFDMKVVVPVGLLSKPGLVDMAQRAEAWQSVTCPPDLFFNHGEYLGAGGIDHICRELQEKPDSNRALGSLISQTHIVDSGDGPLPSFLVVQCLLDGPTLYMTTIYRALELSTFFRINLEEIRLMAKKIYDGNRTVEQVALCVFATRAYVKEGMNPLEKCEIDRVDQVDIMTTRRSHLPRLLRDKARQSTFPVATGIQNLLGIARNGALPAGMQVPGHGPLLIQRLEATVSSLEELAELRKTASHHRDIETLETRLSRQLEELAAMIEAGAR